MKIDAKIVFRFAKFAKKSTRPMLENIKIESDAIVATDSYKLLRIKGATGVTESQLLNVPDFKDKFKKTSGEVEFETQEDGSGAGYMPNYPNYEQILPKTPPKETICFDAKHMIEILEQFTDRDGSRVLLEIRERGDVIMIKGGEKGNQNTDAMLMPCKPRN